MIGVDAIHILKYSSSSEETLLLYNSPFLIRIRFLRLYIWALTSS